MGINTILHHIKIDKYKIPVLVMKLKTYSIISVPTQIGCPIQCSFCISSTNKFIRSLNLIEIKHIITMLNIKEKYILSLTGEGEINLNIKLLNEIIDEFEYDKQIKSINISTSGYKSKNLDKLKKSNKLNLQYSLHYPNNNIRKQNIKLKENINITLDNLKKNKDKINTISINYVMFEKYDIESFFKLNIPKDWIIKLNNNLSEPNIDYKSKDYFQNILKNEGYNVKNLNEISKDVKQLYSELTYK